MSLSGGVPMLSGACDALRNFKMTFAFVIYQMIIAYWNSPNGYLLETNLCDRSMLLLSFAAPLKNEKKKSLRLRFSIENRLWNRTPTINDTYRTIPKWLMLIIFSSYFFLHLLFIGVYLRVWMLLFKRWCDCAASKYETTFFFSFPIHANLIIIIIAFILTSTLNTHTYRRFCFASNRFPFYQLRMSPLEMLCYNTIKNVHTLLAKWTWAHPTYDSYNRFQ